MPVRSCWCGQIQPCTTHKKQGGSDRRPKLKGSHWRKLCVEVRRRDKGTCQHCGANKGLSVHHLVKARDGGGDTMSNLALLCTRCHTQADRAA